jgi:DNA-binding NarL/FixJ family response regulator
VILPSRTSRLFSLSAIFSFKDVSCEELVRAIEDVAAGRTVLSPAVATRRAERRDTSLSVRGLEVLTLLARGESNKAIAKHLFISEATVKSHLLHVFEKLGVNDRIAAVVRAANSRPLPSRARPAACAPSTEASRRRAAPQPPR